MWTVKTNPNYLSCLHKTKHQKKPKERGKIKSINYFQSAVYNIETLDIKHVQLN